MGKNNKNIGDLLSPDLAYIMYIMLKINFYVQSDQGLGIC